MRRAIRTAALAAASVLLGAIAASAQQTPPDPLAQWIGRPIVAVEVRIEGKPDTSPALLAMVDIKPGDKVSPDAWRKVLARFDQVPRFEDAMVKLEERPDGVVLIFDLEPRHPISDVTFTETPGVSSGELLRQLRERFNGLPESNELVDVQEEVRNILSHEGYLSATAVARVEKDHDRGRAVMVVSIDAGPRTLITDWEIRGKSPLDQAKTLARLGLVKGAPYRDREMDARLAEIRDDLRNKKFYKAVAQQLKPRISADNTGVVPVIIIDAGPVVELRVSDGMPGSVDELIPIKRENSVDADLLDEAKDNIRQQLGRQGYKEADVKYTTEQPNPDLMIVTFTIFRGRRYRVMGFDSPSDFQAPAEVLRAQKEQKALEVGAWFDEVAVRASLEVIRRKYQDLGYHRIPVMKPDFEVVPGRSADEGGIVIHPNITPGPKATIRDITFDLGDRPIVTKEELTDLMDSKKNQPYALANLVTDRRKLPASYESLGFLNAAATVTPIINPAGTDVTLAVFAREGPRVFVGEIVVLGNEHVKAEVILGEITLKTGAPYSPQARLDSQLALNNLSSLRTSRITIADRLPGESTVRIVISVVESDSTTFEPGAGIEGGTHPRSVEGGGFEDRVEFAPRVSIGVGRRNLGGRDRAINFFGRLSLRPKNAPGDPELDGKGFGFADYRVTATYAERHAFRTPTNILFNVTSEQGIRTNFSFIRRVGTANFFRALTPELTVLGTYRLEWTKLFDELIDPRDQPLVDRLFPQLRLSIFSGGAIWVRRPDPRFPTATTQANANLDFSARKLGSEVAFVKAFTQGSIVRPIRDSNRLMYGFRVQLGLARGFVRSVEVLDANGDPIIGPNGEPLTNLVADLPASQRFFAGGSTTVRGFQLDRLGVREILTEDGLSNGGNAMIVGNAEIRAVVGKLFKRELSVVGFVDTGNVFHRASDLDLGRLRTALGFGVRYDSPLGPLRLDIGFKTDEFFFAKATERRWEFHLSLGEVF